MIIEPWELLVDVVKS